MSIENEFYKILSGKRSSKSKYDCLVLFSGGKDSTYLAHLIKQVKAERVCLFTVDNSFEDDHHVKEVAAKLNLDLYIYKPSEADVVNLYNFLLSEPSLKKVDSNPLCILCNRYFTSLGVDFAHQLGIPFVISGVTITQVIGSSLPPSLRLVKIAEKALNAKYADTYEIIKTTKKYKEDPTMQQIIDKMYNLPEDVAIVNPFLYCDYNIENIKKELQDTYDWQNPDPNIPNEKYISSGCKLSEIFGLCERKLGFEIHELQQFKQDYNEGGISEEAINYNIKALKDLLNKDVTPEMKAMITKLKLEDKLLSD